MSASGVSYMINIFPREYHGPIPVRRYLHPSEFKVALATLGFNAHSVEVIFDEMQLGKSHAEGPVPLSEEVADKFGWPNG